MSQIDDFLNLFPKDVQDSVRTVWEALGSNEKNHFLSLISAIPMDAGLLKRLIKLSSDQVRQAFGKKHVVVILGPANVGKSTLYNQLVRSKVDNAEVGPLPGTTRENQQADAGLFTIYDTPGTDAVGAVGEREHNLALEAADQADFIIVVFDAIQGVKRSELELFHELKALKKSFVVVLNKTDLVKNKDLNGVIEKAASNLGLSAEQIIPAAAKEGKNLAQILLAIAATEPEMMAALGQALPEFRWQLAWQAIVRAASLSAVIALAPLPMIDFIPLVATQSVMVLGIARIYSYKITPQRATELVTTFGLGFLARTLFQELAKLEGIPGWLLSAAIASSTTVVMGYAAILWFEKGQKLSSKALRKLTRSLTGTMLDTLKSLGKRKPTRKQLEEKIAKSLEESPMAESQEFLDEKAKE